MNKSVRKAIMVRTQLLNKFRKENSFIDELAYKRQHNFCITLIKKTKRNFYNNLDPLSAKITKWSNTLKQFVGNLPTNCLSVFDHFVGLVLKGLM